MTFLLNYISYTYNNLPYYILSMDKKQLLFLWLTTLPAVWFAQNEMDSVITNTSQQAIEVIKQEHPEKWGNIISFDDAQKLQNTISVEEIGNLLNNPEIRNKILNDTIFQKLLKKYNLNEEEAEKIIEYTLSNKEAFEKIQEILNDEYVKKSDFENLQSDFESLKNELDKANDGTLSTFIVLTIWIIMAYIMIFSDPKTHEVKRHDSDIKDLKRKVENMDRDLKNIKDEIEE